MKPEEDPDVQLMLAVKRDDRQAFETLFRKYAEQLVGFATSFVSSRARAEELAQDTFVQLYDSRRRYEPRARFATWLYRIATNLCLSELRRAEHRHTLRPEPTADDDEGFQIDSLPDPEGRDTEENVSAKETVQRMREALQELPPQQRAALLLARVEGLSYVEVAQALGCSVAAVKSLIHRATLNLKGRFDKIATE